MSERLPYSVWFPLRNPDDIKAYPPDDSSSSGGNTIVVKDDSMDYKEGENKIGTYLGKDLYRYVDSSYTIPNSSGETLVLADVSKLSIGEVTNLKAYLPNAKRFVSASANIGLSLTYDYATGKVMVYSFGNEYDNEPCTIIIEYTKK